MGLRHLPEPNRHNDTYHAHVFNNTWGHYAPQKNISYKGKVRFVLTDHSQYGSQPIVMEYDFPNLSGPYIHDKLFDDVCNWGKIKWEQTLKTGVVYEREVTFRNYRFYYGKIKTVFQPMELLTNIQT